MFDSLIKVTILSTPLFASFDKQRLTKMSLESIKERFCLPKRFENNKPSVWSEYTKLNVQYKPINLGQGYSDAPPPPFVRDALIATVTNPNYGLNQYTRGAGHPRLVQALSTLYSKLVNRKVDAFTEILVTCGAYEALFASIFGHIDNGDEVILIEPFFDCYEPMVNVAGGKPCYIPLRLKNTHSDNITAGDYVLDDAELEAAFSKKPKMIIINTPHNPMGKVFNREELTKIADLCKKHNTICVSDEVYEWLIYDGNEHVRMCTLPGMWDRTITIGSAGKTFSVTGWKTGWAYGPAHLMANLEMVHQYCVDTIPTLIQEALAIMFEDQLKCYDSPECYFRSLPAELKLKRDYMMKFLKSAGMKPILPQGGFFLVADWSPLEKKIDLSDETDAQKDYRFTKWITKNIGVHGIPPSAFFSDDHKKIMENFVRFCFFKKDENLQKGAEILEKWANK